jgi:hypothetical protein
MKQIRPGEFEENKIVTVAPKMEIVTNSKIFFYFP